MKYIPFYASKLGCKDENSVFDYLIQSMKPSLMLWTYFVNWDKVFKYTKKIEVELNMLNYLIGKPDFDNEFRFLLREHKKLCKVLPALVVRGSDKSLSYNILVDFQNQTLVYEDYNFNIEDVDEVVIEKCLKFIKETGIKDLLVNKKIKNLVDYMIGVEAGLDSNARKNRGGKSMEEIVKVFIGNFCDAKGYKFITQADAKKVASCFGYEIPVDKSSRKYDYVIDTGKDAVIFETNFYGGGGSKLKSTAGEYRNLYDVLNGKFKFIWITDGSGWKKASRPLRETFDHNDYVINLAMVEKGILNEII